MFHKEQLLILLIVMPLITIAQIRVTECNDTLTPAKIVRNYFIGEGILVSNIVFKGDPDALAIFTDTGARLGFNEGIILSTGLARHVCGPNSRDNAGANFARHSFLDEDMKTKTDMCDGAVLEFDFVPQKDSILFDFVFGSEEYPEFVNHEFNDIFAFYVYKKTPPRSKAYNMGKLPNGKTVMINNVNDRTNGQWYIANNLPTMPLYDYIEYDGLTTMLTAAANVEPYKTYHLKIIIADLGDCEYDSGVLLRSRSMSSIYSVARAQKIPKPISKQIYLNFAQDSYNLLPKEEFKVRKLADSLSIYRFDSIVVVGNTDSTGKEDYNTELSFKRALTVQHLLSKQLNKSVIVKAYGKGSRIPLRPNTTEENKSINRRVELLLYPRKSAK
ncbi:MAG: choice-of-anchor L domain-containing protein [Bacteroidota bacterium]|jgi:outer membrane protein OmpA-like peptidoglycan-associated protein|nr:OmpA family protein [Sphingobacteriales bacterium]